MSFNENKGAFILVGVLEVCKTPEANIGTIYESSNFFHEYLTPLELRDSAFQKHLFPNVITKEIPYILILEWLNVDTIQTVKPVYGGAILLLDKFQNSLRRFRYIKAHFQYLKYHWVWEMA